MTQCERGFNKLGSPPRKTAWWRLHKPQQWESVKGSAATQSRKGNLRRNMIDGFETGDRGHIEGGWTELGVTAARNRPTGCRWKVADVICRGFLTITTKTHLTCLCKKGEFKECVCDRIHSSYKAEGPQERSEPRRSQLKQLFFFFFATLPGRLEQANSSHDLGLCSTPLQSQVPGAWILSDLLGHMTMDCAREPRGTVW